VANRGRSSNTPDPPDERIDWIRLTQGGPILFHDGECGVCSASVRFLLARDGADPAEGTALRFAPLTGRHAEALRQLHPALVNVDSVLWVTPGSGPDTVRQRSDAVLAALRYLGGGWALLARFAQWIPRPVRDGVYDLVARHRQSISRRGRLRCALPDPGVSGRFLD
jgi:predicted DCC family thiol-disulfide oxidoreductase YuxK